MYLYDSHPKGPHVLELAILGLLKEQDLHGYELKKRLAEALGPMARVSFGSLYPALNRLQRNGAVETLSRSEATRAELDGGDEVARPIPATGSMAGEAAAFRAGRAWGTPRAARTRSSRVRKVYRITSEGEEAFHSMLTGAAGAEDERAFGLRLAFCRYLSPTQRLALLENRRAHLADRLAQSRAAARWRDRMDRYARSLVEHHTESTERDITWLDGLIAAERDQSFTTPVTTPTVSGATPAVPGATRTVVASEPERGQE